MDLILSLKGIYFDQVKSGTKTEEFRLCNEYWRKRLERRHYDRIILKRGYPKRGDLERIIERPWRGYEKRIITHTHFGSEPVEVFAIRLGPCILSDLNRKRIEDLLESASSYKYAGKLDKSFDSIKESLDLCDWHDVIGGLFTPRLFENIRSYCKRAISRLNQERDKPDFLLQGYQLYSYNQCLCFIHNYLGSYEEAERVSRENIASAPLFPYAYIDLGTSFEGRNRIFEAAESFRMARLCDYHFTYGIESFHFFLTRRPEVLLRMPEYKNITPDERNEFHRMHGSSRRVAASFTGEVKNAKELEKMIEDVNEKIRQINEEGIQADLEKKLKH